MVVCCEWSYVVNSCMLCMVVCCVWLYVVYGGILCMVACCVWMCEVYACMLCMVVCCVRFMLCMFLFNRVNYVLFGKVFLL
jgi:hypothetical protein